MNYMLWLWLGAMVVFGIVEALTGRFRRSVAGADGAFTFGRGFTHTLFMGFYASIWVAVGIFVYLRYFDNGAIFSDYAATLSRPELQQALQESGLLEQLNAASGEVAQINENPHCHPNGGIEAHKERVREAAPEGERAVRPRHAASEAPRQHHAQHRTCQRHEHKQVGAKHGTERIAESHEREPAPKPEPQAVLHGVGIGLLKSVVVLGRSHTKNI